MGESRKVMKDTIKTLEELIDVGDYGSLKFTPTDIKHLSHALSTCKQFDEAGVELPEPLVSNLKHLKFDKIKDKKTAAYLGQSTYRKLAVPIVGRLKARIIGLDREIEYLRREWVSGKEEIARLKKTLSTAHKVFGSESDKLGKIITKLKARIKELLKFSIKELEIKLERDKGIHPYTEQIIKLKARIKELEDGKGL